MEKSLRETVRQVLLSDVVRMDGGGKGGASDAWRVMVLDARATRVISSVVGMYDIMEGHVTVVEDLHKVRVCVRGLPRVGFWGCAGNKQRQTHILFDRLLAGAAASYLPPDGVGYAR